MKKFGQLAVLLLLVGSACAQTRTSYVNPIIGDESYVAIFGSLPDQYSDELTRVKTHLMYAENKLRERTPEGLSEQQKKNRETVLNHLRDYWSNGVFPNNFDYPDERRPCFIDRNGAICAVGYLVEKTAGIDLARQINEKHQYDFLADMNEPALAAWAEEHGFTIEECAMIQPTYGPPPAPDVVQHPISKGYGVSSGVVGGLNLAVNTINLSGRFGGGKAISYIGFLSGGAQILMGLTNIRKDKTYGGWASNSRVDSYKAQNNLSYINIAVGTTTMVTSAVNLILANKIKDKKSAVGLYSYPGLNNEMNIGFTMSRRL
jgi:hypothetical protein